MVLRSMIGATVKRKEDPQLITGKGKYVGDMKMAGMRYVAFVRSPYAHATFTTIDASAALERPGVLNVITGKDLVNDSKMFPVAGNDEVKIKRGHYPLSIDRVRHAGEAVAVVIATSAEIAVDALDDIMIDWEPLPVVVDMLDALKTDAPVIFEDMTDNIADTWESVTGDVEGAFAQAKHTLKQRILSPRLAGVPMEGRAIIAAPDYVTDGLTIWNSTQVPHAIRSELSGLLSIPENMIRVVAPNVGGGFGVKGAMYPEDVVLAVLAWRFKAPFKWEETRLENMLTTTHGRGQVADMELAFDDEGVISALRARVIGDMGAYPVFTLIPELTGQMITGTYNIPIVDYHATSVYTNTLPIAAYRGAGRPEAAYYLERMIDLIADELGIDPIEVRRRNYLTPDQFPYKTPTGSLYDSGDYETNLNKAVEVSHYHELRAEQAKRRAENNPKLLGIGVATYVEMCGFGPYESALVRVEPSGTVTVYTGTSPHGQGGETTFAQIVADHIGADFDRIIVKHGDTGSMPMGIGTFGSRGLAIGGAAIVQASTQVREKAQKIAAHMLEAAEGDIELINGQYQVRGVPDRGLKLADIADRAYSDNLPDEISTGLEATDFFRPAELIYPFGTHIAVVEIDTETGHVTLRDYFSIDDCGPRISPLLVEGQIHGGLAQGIGEALIEEIIYDDQGQLITGSLMDYALPRADLFPHFHIDKTVTTTPNNPLGAKGIGEAATIGSTPAVVNAVVDALEPYGVHHLDMPLRSTKVWQAIQNGK